MADVARAGALSEHTKPTTIPQLSGAQTPSAWHRPSATPPEKRFRLNHNTAPAPQAHVAKENNR
jgi:hypothetical protein